MRISYELEEPFAHHLEERARVRGVPVDALAQQVVLDFLGAVESSEDLSATGLTIFSSFNSLEGAEALDWSGVSELPVGLDRHQAELYALGE